jgi:hypothetical protein
MFCRINLDETNYRPLKSATLLDYYTKRALLGNIQNIYKEYCIYKQFQSFMPVFNSEILNNDVIGYYDGPHIVAWSLLRVYDDDNVESVQFAWNYHRPELKLGYNSLKHECSFYKSLGYKYLYLGETAEYKTKYQGFELLGPIQ